MQNVKVYISKLNSLFLVFNFVIVQNVKAYLRRGTAREMLGYYKEATEGVFPFAPLPFFLQGVGVCASWLFLLWNGI